MHAPIHRQSFATCSMHHWLCILCGTHKEKKEKKKVGGVKETLLVLSLCAICLSSDVCLSAPGSSTLLYSMYQSAAVVTSNRVELARGMSRG